MTSLSEVYTPDAEFQTSLRRLYAGLGLFAFGALLIVAGIVVGTTGLVEPLFVAREWAGILAGIGVPAVFLGTFAVLPSGKTTKVAAAIGAALALLGVALFAYAFPCQWSGTNCLGPNQSLLTLPVALVYVAGAGTTLWCLFTAVANFKARNNPGGTAHVEVTAQGETRIIEVPKAELSKFSGSMGVLGDPAEDVETTDRPGAETDDDDGSSVFRTDERGVVSDGGATSNTISDVSDDVLVQGGGDDTTSSQSGPASPSGASTTGSSASTHSSGADSTQHGADATSDPSTDPAAGKVDSVEPTSHGRPGSSARRDDDWTPSGKAPENRAASGPDRDSYCGSCAHFEYVQTDRGMQPYCGFHDEVMDDMEACDDYSPRTQ
jgi:cytochrome c biogenesis protein CcdA